MSLMISEDSTAEYVDNAIAVDYVSQGIKVRTTSTHINASAATIIGIAFVEPEPDSKDGAQLRAR